LVEYYAQLAAIRNEYSALRTGSVEYLDLGNSNLLAHLRSDKDATLLTIANNSQSEQTYTLGYDAVDLVSGKAYAAQEKISIPALRGVILAMTDEAREITVNYADLAPAWDARYIVGAEQPVENPFTDIDEGTFYYDPVLWAVEEGITNGATATTFDPNGDLLRAQVVAMLWRHAGKPEATIANPFADINEGDWYYDAVLWAVEKGITNGVDSTHFAPFGKTNRAQAVTFLWRYLGEPESKDTVTFPDVTDHDAFYYEAVLWAVENGVTNGMDDGNFGIDVNCNRAYMVTFLYRAIAK
jgi:hypothetical protein